MGVITGGAVAEEGHVFLLDRQLAHVLEIDPDGRFLGSLGRAGQGPGELEHPSQIGLTSLSQGANPVILRLEEEAGHRVLATRNLVFLPDNEQANKNALWSVREDGSKERVFFSGEHRIYHDPPAVSEEGLWFCDNSWDLQADGTLVVAPHRDRYVLEFRGQDGQLRREVCRSLKPHQRTAEERHEAVGKLRFWGEGRELRARKTILGTDPMFRSLRVLQDGTIWVRTCFHQRDLPPGVAMRYDVFAPTGEFLKEVRLACAFDGERDYWQLLEDGSFLLFRNGRSALNNMYSSVEDPGDETEDEDGGNLTVVHFHRAP